MGDRIDSKIEDHRRDPDPHPRWKRQIDAAISGLQESIDLLAPGGEIPVIPDAGTATPQPVSHGVPAQPGTAAPFAREDHRHALVLPPSVEAIASITGTGVVQRNAAGALRAVQQPNGLVAVWDTEGMSSRPGLAWVAGGTQEPWADFTMDGVLTDYYGHGSLSPSAGWVWQTNWGEASMDVGWYSSDYTISGNQTIAVDYGAEIGSGDCGFSLKLFIGEPAGSPKNTIDFPLGRFHIFQDQDALYVYNAVGAVLWSRSLPDTGTPEEWITLAVTAAGSLATVYHNGVQVATGAAPAGSATGATITYSNWAWPNQWRTCGFCELVVWDELPNAAAMLAAKLRQRPTAAAAPDALEIGPDADLRVLDHAAATQRLQTAMPDGTLTPIAEAVWTPGTPESTDGTAGATWAALGYNPSANIYDIASNGAGVIVAVGITATLQVHRSVDDGANWTAYDTWPGSPAAGLAQFSAVCWTGTEFVATGYDGVSGVGGFCAASTDGITWSTRTPNAVGVNYLTCIVAGGGKLVGGSNTDNQIRSSSDAGVTWDTQTLWGATSCVAYHSGRFLAGVAGKIFWSDDAVTWTESTGAVLAGVNWCGIASTGTHLVAVSDGGTTVAVSTDNGVTWSAGGTLPMVCKIIVYSGGYLCAVGSAGNSTRSNDNGATWEAAATISCTAVQRVCATPDHLVAAALYGAYTPTFISTASGSIPGTDSLLTLGPDTHLDVDGLVHANSVQVDDQAGTGVRLVAAGADGTQEALANPGTNGSYGGSSKTLAVTVDLQGRISAIAEPSIRIVTSQVDGLATTLEYDVDDRLSVVTTASGTKTLAYNVDGTLATITGTGSYQSKSFTYTDGRLTGVAIT